MKLFLASSLDKTVSLLLPKLSKRAEETRVIFVANASDPFEDKSWVDLDRQALVRAGFILTEIDLREISGNEFIQRIISADMVHICGGSVFYLLSLLKQKGIDKIIIEFVCENKILYTGTSAGSVIASSSIQLYVYDEEEKKFAENTTDFSGLGLVNFLIIPHSENQKFSESNKNMIEHLPEYSQPVILLYDSQAIWVDYEKLEILSAKLQ